MTTIAWLIDSTLVCLVLFEVAHRLGFRARSKSAFLPVSRIIAFSPLIFVTSMITGAFGAPVLFLCLWILKLLGIVPEAWLKGLSLWLFTLGSIITGYLMLFCWIGIGNWQTRRTHAKVKGLTV
jgi:hypothetical protein